MKKILLSIVLLVSGTSFSQVAIRPYTAADKDVVMKICLQDPLDFFCGSHMVRAGFMSEEQFKSEGKKKLEEILDGKPYVKLVLTIFDEVIGFVAVYKTKEQSVESLKRYRESQGLLFDEKRLLAVMPNLKKTDAECKEYAELEALAVDKAHRNRGYARALIKEIEHIIRQLWPTITKIQLNTNESNSVVRRLYESEGFYVSLSNSAQLAMMKLVTYVKDL